MHRLLSILICCLLSTCVFAKECKIYRSCLELKNHVAQPASIVCDGLDVVFASGNAQGTTQLNLGWGDGMGAPEPRIVNCSLMSENIHYDFSIYNPYWGPHIEFNLIANNSLVVTVISGWDPQQVQYKFNW